jgi:methylenetetrahydrofolate reductase (NADPH)
LLDALAGIDHGIERIGVACYPEGHPKIPDDALNVALHRKRPQVDYMVSQLCFDVDALLGWLRETRSQGIHLPLHLGIAAPMNRRKLIELSVKIGVGSSVRYLTKQHGFVTNLLRGGAYQPEDLLHEIGEDLSSEELGIQRLHLFSFNQIDAAVDWQRRTGGPAETAAV